MPHESPEDARIAVLEAKMNELYGNGKDGRVKDLEKGLRDHGQQIAAMQQQWKFAYWAAVGFLSLLQFLGHNGLLSIKGLFGR